MQTPTKKTPVSKCVNLARFAETMFSKFPQNAALVSLTTSLASTRGALAQAQHAYSEATSEIVHTRAEVRFADYIADNVVRSTIRGAEDADGHKGGKIALMVAPGGATPIIKPVGATQVKEMRDLEGRLGAASGQWSQAAAKKAEIETHRKAYEEALEKRRAAGQKASDARAARDTAKEDFLDVYAKVAAQVKVEFPRDRRMQDLFFDTVWDDSSAAEEEDDEEDAAQAPPPAVPEGGATPS